VSAQCVLRGLVKVALNQRVALVALRAQNKAAAQVDDEFISYGLCFGRNE